jgi:hypothetical protein
MGIASKLEGILQKQIKCHAAWLPLANSFALGDYGLISGGVFTKMGSVKEFGGSWGEEQSPSVKLDFVSAGTTVTNFVGEAEVKALPKLAANASVRYKFEEAESFLLRASTVRVNSISNLNALMKSLKSKGDWEKRFSVVRQVWLAEDAAVLCTLKAGTEVTFSGDVPALEQLSIGKADVSLSIATSQELGLKLVGKTGVIGLGFAKFGFFGDVKTLAVAPAATDGQLESVADEGVLTDDL